LTRLLFPLAVQLLPKQLKTLAKVGGSSGSNGLPSPNLPSENFRCGPDREDALSPPIQCGDWELLERFEEDNRPKIILPGKNPVHLDLINMAGRLTTKFASEIKEGKHIEADKEYSEQERGEIAVEHARNALQDPDSIVLIIDADPSRVEKTPQALQSVEMAEIKEKLPKADHATLRKVRDVLAKDDKSAVHEYELVTNINISPPSSSLPRIANGPDPEAKSNADAPPCATESKSAEGSEGNSKGQQWSFGGNALLGATAAVAAVIVIGYFCPSAGNWLATNFGTWFPQFSFA